MAVVGARRPAARRGDEPAGRDHRAGRGAGRTRRSGRPGVRRPVVHDGLHPAVRGAADHRWAPGRHRRAAAGVRRRRHRLPVRVRRLRPGARHQRADRLPCGAGGRGGPGHSADHRPDQSDVRRCGTGPRPGRHRPGDGARRRLRAGARRLPHPRRPVRLVLAGGVPGERPPVAARPRPGAQAGGPPRPAAPHPRSDGHSAGHGGRRAHRPPADRGRPRRTVRVELGLHRGRADADGRLRTSPARRRRRRAQPAGGAELGAPPSGSWGTLRTAVSRPRWWPRPRSSR